MKHFVLLTLTGALLAIVALTVPAANADCGGCGSKKECPAPSPSPKPAK